MVKIPSKQLASELGWAFSLLEKKALRMNLHVSTKCLVEKEKFEIFVLLFSFSKS